MMFIYCSLVTTRWERSVHMYKIRKETAVYRRGDNTQNRGKKNTENTK